MKIIIAGAGEVGFHLAKLLSFESQDITLIDLDKDALAYAENHLDIRAVKGNATSISVLKKANVGKADLIIAVTGVETANITIGVLANELGVGQSIANISNTEFINNDEDIGFKKFGIDELISPETLAANEISLLLNQSAFDDTYQFDNGALIMVGTTLSGEAPFVGKTVQVAAKIFPELHFIPIAIQRMGTQFTIIPRGSTEFRKGDHVYFITAREGVDELYKLTGKEKTKIKDVMILGGSKIGAKSAKDLCANKFNIKLVEKIPERAFDLADNLPKALVINGDGRNVELLEEENLHDMDAFVAVTGNSETNIMSCLIAKSKGVPKTIALVENMDYFQLSHSIGVDTLINKKLLAANSIFRYVRRGEVLAMTKLNNMNAELLEFEVKYTSKVANTIIKEIDFPRSAIIAGVVRGEEGLIPLGDFKIKPADKVVVCCLPKAIVQVEKLFV
ncbi:Trk system potassium transporter TrkA [Aquimarina agarivorans]|uniref:Trk system potassium transporter TrkA n=1 Tax=Aquimarina agarivorans TaxID=980584 RepID=UPI000248EC05|nr:Trk system potassium transporter TrkA [Aquimarina agarivorans]